MQSTDVQQIHGMKRNTRDKINKSPSNWFFKEFSEFTRKTRWIRFFSDFCCYLIFVLFGIFGAFFSKNT